MTNFLERSLLACRINMMFEKKLDTQASKLYCSVVFNSTDAEEDGVASSELVSSSSSDMTSSFSLLSRVVESLPSLWLSSFWKCFCACDATCVLDLVFTYSFAILLQLCPTSRSPCSNRLCSSAAQIPPYIWVLPIQLLPFNCCALGLARFFVLALACFSTILMAGPVEMDIVLLLTVWTSWAVTWATRCALLFACCFWPSLIWYTPTLLLFNKLLLLLLSLCNRLPCCCLWAFLNNWKTSITGCTTILGSSTSGNCCCCCDCIIVFCVCCNLNAFHICVSRREILNRHYLNFWALQKVTCATDIRVIMNCCFFAFNCACFSISCQRSADAQRRRLGCCLKLKYRFDEYVFLDVWFNLGCTVVRMHTTVESVADVVRCLIKQGNLYSKKNGKHSKA